MTNNTQPPANVIQKYGNIFTTSQPALGQGVNPQGVMLAGFAVKVAGRHPGMLPAYAKACFSRKLKLGGHQIIPISVTSSNQYSYIVNLATQRLGGNATHESIRVALVSASEEIRNRGITGIALPQIGAGLGHLDWAGTEAVIHEIAAEYPEITYELWSYEK